MINVSTESKALMRERTDFRCWAEMTLTDGTELTLGAKDFMVAGNSVTDGAGAKGLPLGAAVCRTVRLCLANQEGKLDGYEFYGARMRLYLTFQLSETEERVELGMFTVTEPESRGETVTVTAADDMYRTDRAYTTALPYPTTLGAMFREICDSCGVDYATAEFPNCDLAVMDMPGEGYTCRQMLGHIAMLAGGNARVHRDGRMEILSYDPEKEPDHELTEWITLTPDTDDVTVTGLEATDSEGNKVLEGAEGYVLAVDDPLMAGQESQALAAMGQRLIGLKVRRFQGEYIAYPLAECMDTARIVDRKGNAFTTVLTDVSFTFGGRTALSNSAEAAVRNASRYATPETKARQTARQLVAAERSARQAAVQALNDRLANASGMYETEERQPDGSVIYYLHDKRELGQSEAVMKLTGDSIGFSTDGGKTYPFGFTITGEMVMGIIRSEGISADWVKVGGQGLGAVLESFVGRDENNKIVSMLNAAADQINIRGNRFVLDSDNFKVAADGSITARNGQFAGVVDADAFTLQGAGLGVKEDYVTCYRGDDTGPDAGGAIAPDTLLVITSDVGVKIDRLFSSTANIADIGCSSGSFSKLIATNLKAYEISENGTPLILKYLPVTGGRLTGPLTVPQMIIDGNNNGVLPDDAARGTSISGDVINVGIDKNGIARGGIGCGYLNAGGPVAAKLGDLTLALQVCFSDGTVGLCCPEIGRALVTTNRNGVVILHGTANAAERLTTARSVFGQGFDGTGNVGGQALVYGTYSPVPGNRYGSGGIQIRENGLVGASQLDIGFAPSVGFHWSGVTGGSLVLGSDSVFRFLNIGGGIANLIARLHNPLYFSGGGQYDGSAPVTISAASVGAVWRAGDTLVIGSLMPLAGVVSNGTTMIPLTLPLGKPVASGVNAYVTALQGTLRGTQGYIDGSGEINFKGGGAYTVSTVLERAAGLLRITIQKSSAFTNVANNTPVSFLTSALVVSFTASADEPMPGPEIFADEAGGEGPSVEDGIEPPEEQVAA